MKRESRTCYTNSANGKWEVCFVEYNADKVHEWLMTEMIKHYIHKSNAITKVTDVNNYDGTRTITVYYDKCFHLKNVYVVRF